MKTSIFLAVMATFLLLTSVSRKPEVLSRERYGTDNHGTSLTIKFERGKFHNHPLFAIWLADENGHFIETLYVSQTIGKGVFPRVNRKAGMWMAGEIQRPAALPYWAHQRGKINEYGTYLPTPRHPEVDGVTGATPKASFLMELKTSQPLHGIYKVLLELNQSWDWNEYWTNDKFPKDKEYNTSSQPALVYSATINTNSGIIDDTLKPIGYSHYSGKDGSLTTDLSTLTTALKIAKSITVTINQK